MFAERSASAHGSASAAELFLLTRPAGTECVKNSRFEAVEEGSPTLERIFIQSGEFMHAIDWKIMLACLLA